jgi:hypothetical protein
MDVPEPSTVNCNVLPEVPACEVPGEVSAVVRAELSVEDECNCKVFADMMQIGNAARDVVTNRYRPLALVAA